MGGADLVVDGSEPGDGVPCSVFRTLKPDFAAAVSAASVAPHLFVRQSAGNEK